MKKNIAKYFVILGIVFIIGIVSCILIGNRIGTGTSEEPEKKAEDSICIVNEKGRVIKQAKSDSILICVRKNNQIITGTATGDISIYCEEKYCIVC